MSLMNTPSGERVHITFFGARNAGKSSLINAVAGQEISIVSDIKGTTTDPVRKSMEILPLGPVVLTDTPGYDDEGPLGDLRVKRARSALRYTDIAVMVIDSETGISEHDMRFRDIIAEKDIPIITVFSKADISRRAVNKEKMEISVSSVTKEGIEELKELIGNLETGRDIRRFIVADLLDEDDIVILVCPIDESAPKGRLILPQTLTIRELLDHHIKMMVCQPEDLKDTLSVLSTKPKMVITDSQAFGAVSKDTPDNVLLTSFSILFARYKGDLNRLIEGAKALKNIRTGDRILISEGCTHHRQCKDIGTVKIPGWIEEYTGAEPVYEFSSGGDFPDDLSRFSLIVHCGACMLNEKEMKSRMDKAEEQGIPLVNYGALIAQVHGILSRSLEPFGLSV
jgi:[FeFe] hydrogenase H-cluster maturation GTPase HydF